MPYRHKTSFVLKNTFYPDIRSAKQRILVYNNCSLIVVHNHNCIGINLLCYVSDIQFMIISSSIIEYQIRPFTLTTYTFLPIFPPFFVDKYCMFPLELVSNDHILSLAKESAL